MRRVGTEPKAQIVAEMADTVGRVPGKQFEHMHLIIDEAEPEN